MPRWPVMLAVLALAALCFAHAEQPKLDELLVYGDGFVLGVMNPAGWQGDTEKAAKRSANIVFYGATETLEGATAPIRVRVGKKLDDNLSKDLSFDMKGYQARYPTVRFEDLRLEHATYPLVSKAFVVDAKVHEYVVYLNPGAGDPHLLSASMSTRERPASAEELAAFRSIVGSLVMMPAKPH